MAERESKRVALVIGINEYEDENIAPLQGSENDAHDILDILRNDEDPEYNYSVHFLIGRDATTENIRARLNDIFFQADAAYDVALFYFSGHVFQDDSPDREGYLAPWDMDRQNPFVKGIKMRELFNIISNSRHTHAVCILDCCYGEAVRQKEVPISTITDQRFYEQIEEFAKLPHPSGPEIAGRLLLASCGHDETSKEILAEHRHGGVDGKHYHGILTYHFIEGLDRVDQGLNALLSDVEKTAGQARIIQIGSLSDLVIARPIVQKFRGATRAREKPSRRPSELVTDYFPRSAPKKPVDQSTKRTAAKKKAVTTPSWVKNVAATLDKPEGISAFDIVDALKQHSKYARTLLDKKSFEPPSDAKSYEWDVWYNSVAALCKKSGVAEDQVLDERLLFLGLGVLNEPLCDAFKQTGIWEALVLEVEGAAVVGQSGPLRDALNSVEFASGFDRDLLAGEDKLGIQYEVNALCEVIMDPNVEPPLAIGLFGRWGTGKSFFMEKMRQQIRASTIVSSKNHVKNVVQITFNAWHYADTNLWASLAVRIFECLTDTDPNKEEREKLQEALETYREAKAELEQKRDYLEAKQEDLEEEIQKAEDERKQVKEEEESHLTDVPAELADLLKDDFNSIARQLGFEITFEQLVAMARGLQTISGYITEVWLQVKHKTVAAGLLAAALVLLVLTPFLTLSTAWFLGLIPAISSVASVTAVVSRYITPSAKIVDSRRNQYLSTIEKATRAEERLMAQRTKEEQELRLKLAKYDEQINNATRDIAALTEKINPISAQINALTARRGLYEFLADRAKGYQKYQGIMGMLHRDFRHLNHLFKEQNAKFRAQEAQHRAQLSTDKTDRPRIERVILYIDDLDRCSPGKVLEVLEAVHLLLAFELFIVVVGVDPRWLKRSLRHQYRDLCSGIDPSTDPYLQTMPTEYLEKIFQVPMTLPRMKAQGYKALISTLTSRKVHLDQPVTLDVSSDPEPKVVEPGSSKKDRAVSRGLLEAQPGSLARGGAYIDLKSAEVEFAKRLDGLIHTPRATKRLINTYRLVRATQNISSRSEFLGTDSEPGEYTAALTLLAIAAGYPSLADEVFVALADDAVKRRIKTWSRFLDELEPTKGKFVPPNLKSPAPDDLLSQDAAEKWREMYKGLRACWDATPPKERFDKLEKYREF
ncbi:MAG: P-loop NTPase fold protein, partial [Halobacteriota archaeon]